MTTMSNEAIAMKYSIYPLYGDAAVKVIYADNVKAAIETAFNCQLIAISSAHIESMMEDFGDDVKERQTFYGVVGALGLDKDGRAVLCSCHIIAYQLTEAREQSDLATLLQLKPKAFAA